MNIYHPVKKEHPSLHKKRELNIQTPLVTFLKNLDYIILLPLLLQVL
jgi:hypothetical protein